MTKFYAIVRIKNDKDSFYHFMSTDSYESKKAFLEDLRMNGYSVKHNKIYTEDEYEKL